MPVWVRVQRPATGSPGSSAQQDFRVADYSPDSVPYAQMMPGTGASDENPVPADVPSIISSEEATDRLEVPQSIEEVGNPKKQGPLKLSWTSVIPWRV
jgi:hypothetical protein